MDFRLTIVAGERSGQSVRIPPGRFVIGREETCELVIDEPFVSGFHCMLLRDEATLRIQDLDSKNGTFVNGHRIGSGTFPLQSGDAIAIGSLTFHIEGIESELESDDLASDTTDLDVNAPKKEQTDSN